MHYEFNDIMLVEADMNQNIQAENWKLSDEIMDAKITFLLPLSTCTRTCMHGFLTLDNSACSLAILKLAIYYTDQISLMKFYTGHQNKVRKE